MALTAEQKEQIESAPPSQLWVALCFGDARTSFYKACNERLSHYDYDPDTNEWTEAVKPEMPPKPGEYRIPGTLKALGFTSED